MARLVPGKGRNFGSQTAAILQGQEDLQHRLRRYAKIPLSMCLRDSVGVAVVESGAAAPQIAAAQHSNGPTTDGAIADENMKLTDCYYDKKDWRACKDEVCDFGI